MRGRSVWTVSVDSYYIESLNADEAPSPEQLLMTAEELAETTGNSVDDEWFGLTGLNHKPTN